MNKNLSKLKTFIIAEAGVNHNGKIKTAFRLVDIAKKINADCIKFQLFCPESLVTKFAPLAKYQKKNIKNNQSQLKMLKDLQLSYDELKKIKSYCKKKKILFLLSIFGLEEFRILKKLKLNMVKIPSGEINNYPLLEKIAQSNLRVIISTGMATMKEVKFAINILTKNGLKKNKISILQCTTDYPTKLEDVNLRAMISIKKKFNIKVGFSDHTIGTDASVAAVALGAKIIEKHLTLNNNMNGPDHKASLNPSNFSKLVEGIRNVELLLGKKIKKPSKNELMNKNAVRKSIVAKKLIRKGEKFTDQNITSKRPEGGIPPLKWKKVLGKKSKKTFQINQLITL